MSDFRRLAEECFRLALIATKREDREGLLDVAGRWLNLAARSKRPGLFTRPIRRRGFPSTDSRRTGMSEAQDVDPI